MIVDSPNLVIHLLRDIVQKLGINGVQAVAKLELAPKKDAHLVCDIVDEVWGVSARRPDTQHILSGIYHVLE